MLARNRWRDARKIFDAVRARDHIDNQRFLNRFARIARFQRGQFIIARAQNIHRAAQYSPAFASGQPRPLLLRSGSAHHRCIDLRLPRHRQTPENFARGRIDRLKFGQLNHQLPNRQVPVMPQVRGLANTEVVSPQNVDASNA